MLTIILINIIATLTVYLGSYLSLTTLVSSINSDEIESIELTFSQILILPISSSLCLLLLFYYFNYIQYVLVFLIVFASTSSLYSLLYISLKYFYKETYSNTIHQMIAIILSLLILIYWLFTGNLIIHNLLGCSLCITFISTLKFPSLKIAVLCLLLLVGYDIFWVFYSEYFFHKNVMVEVATKVAINPIHAASQYINIASTMKSTIELPLKLIFINFSTGRMNMLGLGDIALPGALVALALRCDQTIQSNELNLHPSNQTNVVNHSKDNIMEQGSIISTTISNHENDENNNNNHIKLYNDSPRLFEHAIVGYSIGLFFAFIGNIITGYPQPALIYLVPGVIIPILNRAWMIGRLNHVWGGLDKIKEST